MPFISITCQNCGGQAQIESGRSAICPYCGNELKAMLDDSGFAFAPDMQAAENMQFAPPPVQQVPLPSETSYASISGNPAEFVQPPRYTQAELAEAQRKRRQWTALNISMLVLEALLLGIGIAVEDFFYDFEFGWGAMMVFGWFAAQPICAFLSGLMRPDDADSDSKTIFRKKVLQGLLFILLSIPVTAAAGGILYAILESLFH